ncbi:MAG: tRNA (N6-isopentenyl adenosine(37)-C2)-methylthiotransferase MiaB [Bacteroidales bacterium]
MKNLFIETYGCQMNFADSEVLTSILGSNYKAIQDYKQADLILINTCSIRDHAEQRVLHRLSEFAAIKKSRPQVRIGIVGCMAERLKEELLNSGLSVDLVAGPDSYRKLPELLDLVNCGKEAIDTLLSEEETYHDILPVRLGNNKVSAFVSIMRGCQNYCAYCVVPYTRGKERSRDPESIISEVKDLLEKGYKEVTLLGQNVNSYKHTDTKSGSVVNFSLLMDKVASINPLLRIRFATSHPKDLSDELLEVMSKHPNICRAIHLPVQSGSSRMLKEMKRKYDRDWYLNRITAIRHYLPDCAISTDIIAGFCSETEEDHQQTLALMKEVGYEFAFMFKYSERPGTFASKFYKDDVPEATKLRRLNEIIDLQQSLSLESNRRDIGHTFEILTEGISKKNQEQYYGRNSQNKVIVFDKPISGPISNLHIGTYLSVKVKDCTAATLIGEIV